MRTEEVDKLKPEHLNRWWEVTRRYLFADLETWSRATRASDATTVSPLRCECGRSETNMAARSVDAEQRALPPGRVDSQGGRDRYLSRVRHRLLRLVQDAAQSATHPLFQLERAFYAHVLFIALHPEVPRRLLSWSSRSNPFRIRRRIHKVIGHYELRISRLIVQGQQQGVIRAGIESHAAASFFVGMIQGLVRRMLADPFQPEILLQEAERVFPIYLECIGVRR